MPTYFTLGQYSRVVKSTQHFRVRVCRLYTAQLLTIMLLCSPDLLDSREERLGSNSCYDAFYIFEIGKGNQLLDGLFPFNVNNINPLIGTLGGWIKLIRVNYLGIFLGYGKQTGNLSNFYSASNLLKNMKEIIDVIITVLN